MNKENIINKRGYRCGGALKINHKEPRVVSGPFYCDFLGKFVGQEEMVNPKYKPYIRFQVGDRNGKIGNFLYYIWDDSRERLFGVTVDYKRVILPKTIKYEKILDKVFQKEIQIHVTMSVGNFDKFVIPVVQRTFPILIAQDLVSVQPMTAPISSVFYTKMRYGSNVGSVKKSV